MSKLVKLNCAVQNYPWGKQASESLVAEFTGNSSDGDKPYAELWMGTHPKGHAVVTSEDKKLSDWIAEDVETRLGSLCPKISGNNNPDLPFLLKILSVNKALSIQVHPTKEHAAELHSKFPQHYPDPNHKPEMAIALTQFEGLCGFKPEKEIIKNLQEHPELTDLLSQGCNDVISGRSGCKCVGEFIKDVFSELLTAKNTAKLTYNSLQNRNSLSASDELFLRIYSQHPGDAGLVCIYLLNHVVLQPGECMFLGANKVHAYFSGDCVECMACSDNVVRAGLTGKFIDVDTLLKMVDCSPGTPESQKLAPVHRTDNLTCYFPPVKDFAVVKVTSDGSEPVDLASRSSPQIILCVEGKGELVVGDGQVSVRAGEVVYVIPDVVIVVTGNLTLFSAMSQDL